MKAPLIAVVDYGMGNLRSVAKALEKAGGRVTVTDSARVIRGAQGVVLPGVGAFGDASRRLAQTGLASAIAKALGGGKPFLGICLGLQLLFDRSEESRGQKGLGFWKGDVVRFEPSPRRKSGSSRLDSGFRRNDDLKVPHMGWNTLKAARKNNAPLLAGVKVDDYFYFVHSFYPVPEEAHVIAATTPYGGTFCSAAAAGSVFASQFHPEKSAAPGQRLLRNFVKQVARCS